MDKGIAWGFGLGFVQGLEDSGQSKGSSVVVFTPQPWAG